MASLPANMSRAPGKCGNVRGNSSWKARSVARMATSGAVEVLALLPSAMVSTSRPRASGLRTSTIRSGWLFIEVGAHLARS